MAKFKYLWYSKSIMSNVSTDEKKTPILTIGAVAKILGVHQRTLRIYDEQNILVPKRSSHNKRLYSLEDIELGRFILFLTRNLAINLAGVKIILTLAQKNKVPINDYVKYIKGITDLSEHEQENNAKRLSTRGRKPVAY